MDQWCVRVRVHMEVCWGRIVESWARWLVGGRWRRRLVRGGVASAMAGYIIRQHCTWIGIVIQRVEWLRKRHATMREAGVGSRWEAVSVLRAVHGDRIAWCAEMGHVVDRHCGGRGLGRWMRDGLIGS